MYDFPSAEISAIVLPELASDPAPGSVKQYAPIHSPVANLGTYFCFCSSVPYKVIGIVPIPVCAPKAVLKEPFPLEMYSQVIIVETNPIPIPPYSSGTATPKKPSSPAFFITSSVKA